MPVGPLNNIGDELIVDSGPHTQISGMTGLTAIYSNLSDSQVTVEFDYSEDGTTYNGYVAANDPNYQAVVLDPNTPLYLRHRFIRTGGTGTADVASFRVSFTYDRDAISAFGVMANDTLTADFIEIIPLLVNSYNVQINNTDHFEIHHAPREFCPLKDSVPAIYFHQIQRSGATKEATCLYSEEVSFRIGIKFDPCNVSHQGLLPLWDRFQLMFDRANALRFKYSFTFKETPFFGAFLADFGINGTEISGQIEYPSQHGPEGYEMTVSMVVYYELFPVSETRSD